MREEQWPLKEYARLGRRSMNDAETRLWSEIRCRWLGVRFRRQYVIGPYIVDFVCLSLRLIIEGDGFQHIDSAADRRRDAYIARRGYRVLRVASWDVLGDIDQVMMAISHAIQDAEHALV